MTLSIIVPVLNESAQLPALITHLRVYKQRECEVIFVDGGSSDQTVESIVSSGFTVIHSEKGRAVQMNAGATLAKGDVLLFLHADTQLPDNAETIIQTALTKSDRKWGRFNVIITGQSSMLKVIAWFMNHRSRLTSIVTGDQAIFVRADLFNQVSGFPEQALMEDIELSKQLKIQSPAISLKHKVITSGRRWEKNGIWKTIYLMWYLRYAYWRGVSPEQLVSKYR